MIEAYHVNEVCLF